MGRRKESQGGKASVRNELIAEFIFARTEKRTTRANIEGRYFRVHYNTDYSELKEIYAGVPQESLLGPTMYPLYTRHIYHDDNTIIATFVDDTTSV